MTYINLLMENDQLTPKYTQELAHYSTMRLMLDVTELRLRKEGQIRLMRSADESRIYCHYTSYYFTYFGLVHR